MRIRTTTAQINVALPLLELVKAECYNKDTYTTSVIDKDTCIENLQFFAESGVLTDCMGWTYERNPDSDKEYIFETGRMNQESNAFITVWMRLNDGVTREDLEKILKRVEPEEYEFLPLKDTRGANTSLMKKLEEYVDKGNGGLQE